MPMDIKEEFIYLHIMDIEMTHLVIEGSFMLDDFPAKIGTPVKCTGNGVVTKAQFDSRFGNFIEIDHGYGYKTVYAHLKDGFCKKRR